MTGYFEYRHTVEFDEVQVFNVHFATYLRWQSSCRDRLVRRAVPDLGLRIVRAECEFFDAIGVDDELSVRLRLEEMVDTEVQFTFDYVRVGDDRLVARGRQRVACLFDGAETTVPVELRAALMPYAESPVLA